MRPVVPGSGLRFGAEVRGLGKRAEGRRAEVRGLGKRAEGRRAGGVEAGRSAFLRGPGSALCRASGALLAIWPKPRTRTTATSMSVVQMRAFCTQKDARSPPSPCRRPEESHGRCLFCSIRGHFWAQKSCRAAFANEISAPGVESRVEGRAMRRRVAGPVYCRASGWAGAKSASLSMCSVTTFARCVVDSLLSLDGLVGLVNVTERTSCPNGSRTRRSVGRYSFSSAALVGPTFVRTGAASSVRLLVVLRGSRSRDF